MPLCPTLPDQPLSCPLSLPASGTTPNMAQPQPAQPNPYQPGAALIRCTQPTPRLSSFSILVAVYKCRFKNKNTNIMPRDCNVIDRGKNITSAPHRSCRTFTTRIQALCLSPSFIFLHVTMLGHKHSTSVTQNLKAHLATAYNELGKELSSTVSKRRGQMERMG